jgi:uncharacterized membrane-anchored protein YhcB (DUF1043 family)
MTAATFVAIAWRLAAIAAVFGIIIGRIRSLRAKRTRDEGRGMENKKRDGR